MGNQLSPCLCSSVTEEAIETGESALLQQDGNSGMPGIFIFDKNGEMETKFPICPTRQLFFCGLCCMGGPPLPLGWCQTECKVKAQWFWHSGLEETVVTGDWCVWKCCACISSSCQQGPPLACASGPSPVCFLRG